MAVLVVQHLQEMEILVDQVEVPQDITQVMMAVLRYKDFMVLVVWDIQVVIYLLKQVQVEVVERWVQVRQDITQVMVLVVQDITQTTSNQVCT